MPHIDLPLLVQTLGYPGITLAIYLESGVPIGFFLPGASMLFTAGLLTGQGFFNPWILIPLITIAAILGDNTGYWIGRKLGVRLFLRPDSRFFKHRHLERAKRFYDAYGTRAILFGRFVPIVRTFAPIVAGIVAMNYRTFIVYNIMGALGWATGITFLGYWRGAKIPSIGEYLTPIILGIIVITCIPLAWDFINQRKRGEKI